MANLSSLPDELLSHVLWYLSPEETLRNVQLVDHRFHRLAAEPRLWRHHCQRWRYWGDSARRRGGVTSRSSQGAHYSAGAPPSTYLDRLAAQRAQGSGRAAGPDAAPPANAAAKPTTGAAATASAVDWRRLFVERLALDRRVGRMLDDIVSGHRGSQFVVGGSGGLVGAWGGAATAPGTLRQHRFLQVFRLGYDAKDFLLDQFGACPPDADDALARRYWSMALIHAIHKDVAIKTWRKIFREEQVRQAWDYSEDEDGLAVPLEAVVGSFSMFCLSDRHGDLNEITARLDTLAADFAASQGGAGGVATLPTRARSLALASYLHSLDLLGMVDPERAYYAWENSMLDRALFSPPYNSLPLLSAVIFVCIARRLGIDTHPLLLPAHVRVVVYSPDGVSLDGAELKETATTAKTSEQRRMFLDPYASRHEVPLATVASQLDLFEPGDHGQHEARLAPATTVDVARRMYSNLQFSAQRSSEISLAARRHIRPGSLVPLPSPAGNEEEVRSQLLKWGRIFWKYDGVHDPPSADELLLPASEFLNGDLNGVDDAALVLRHLRPLWEPIFREWEQQQQQPMGPPPDAWLSRGHASISAFSDYDDHEAPDYYLRGWELRNRGQLHTGIGMYYPGVLGAEEASRRFSFLLTRDNDKNRHYPFRAEDVARRYRAFPPGAIVRYTRYGYLCVVNPVPDHPRDDAVPHRLVDGWISLLNWNGGSSVGLGSSIAAIEPSDIPDTIPLAFGRYFSRLDRAAGRLIPIDENPRPQAVLAR